MKFSQKKKKKKFSLKTDVIDVQNGIITRISKAVLALRAT